MRGTRHADRRRRLWVESLEARTTPTAMPVPPMPPQPIEVVIFVGPVMPRITLPVEIRIDIETEQPTTPTKNVAIASSVDGGASVSASAIAAAMRQAVALTAQATPAPPRVETPPVFPVETKPPTETATNSSAVSTEEIAALVARLGSAVEPSPGDLVFNWVVPAHTAYWQRPATHQTAEPEAARGGAAVVPQAEIAPAAPMATPAPSTSPDAESRNDSSEAEPLEVKHEAVIHVTKQTLAARMRWAGLLFLGWLKKPRRGATRSGRSRVQLGWLAPGG